MRFRALIGHSSNDWVWEKWMAELSMNELRAHRSSLLARPEVLASVVVHWREVCWPETSSLESWTQRQWHAAMARICSAVGMLPESDQVEEWLAKTPQFAIDRMREAMG